MANPFTDRSQEIRDLLDGHTIRMKPLGNSMSPIIQSGQEVEIVPYDSAMGVNPGDVLFCKVNGRIVLHLALLCIRLPGSEGTAWMICNASGHVNGCTREIYGRVSKIIK